MQNQTEISSIEQLRQGFEAYYLNKLYPFLQEKEAVRKKYLKNFWTLLFISSVISIMMIGLVYMLSIVYKHDIEWGWVYLLLVCVVFVLQTPYTRYIKTVKNDIMVEFIKYFGGFSYRHGAGFDPREIQKSLIFPAYQTIEVDDCFEGIYQGVQVRVCEERLKKLVHRSKGGTREVVLFKGVVVELTMNKKFQGHTIVLKDAGFLNRFNKPSSMENVRLEDVVFEKNFEVYSTDQIEARYLLTTSFMERLVKLKKIFRGSQIQASFSDQKVLFAIDTGYDMFEAQSFFKPNMNKEKLQNVLEQFLMIFSIVDVLKLDRKTGL